MGTIGKILVIRLSSIGDIVLTSPVLRSLRACLPEAEIHFVTKAPFVSLLAYNPHVNKVHAFDGDLDATVKELKAEGFDYILDLHRNIRSRLIKSRLGLPASTYRKYRVPTVLSIKFGIGQLPPKHVVTRYGDTLTALGCQLDDDGLEFFLPPEAETAAQDILAREFAAPPVAVVLGGTHATKRWPKAYFVELLNGLDLPVILLGGKSEIEDAAWISERLQVHHLNAVAQYDLLLSSALMARCRYVITHDTGLMHIAVALDLKVFSLWGSTVPELGFSPYRAADAEILEVTDLGCRPCSKLGFEKCPKGHFRCMRDLTPEVVLGRILGS